MAETGKSRLVMIIRVQGCPDPVLARVRVVLVELVTLAAFCNVYREAVRQGVEVLHPVFQEPVPPVRALSGSTGLTDLRVLLPYPAIMCRVEQVAMVQPEVVALEVAVGVPGVENRSMVPTTGVGQEEAVAVVALVETVEQAEQEVEVPLLYFSITMALEET